MDGLRADVARLALRVLRARLRRNRYGLHVLLVGTILLRAASFFNLLAELVMATFFPVFFSGRPARSSACCSGCISSPMLSQAGQRTQRIA